jgi:sialate O-acetylesterase
VTNYLLAFFLLLFCSASAFAEVKLAAIFNDGMVLQRDKPIPVWGKADAGETVSARLGPQEKKTTADNEGKWRVDLDPLPANYKPSVLTITGKNTIEVKNVLVGEVWVCAGQSNMAFKLGESLNGKETAANSNYPTMRVFAPAHRLATTKGQDVAGKWVTVTPETAASITAVGFYFARDLTEKLKVPIGLIDTSWGSTAAEAWTPVEYLAAKEELRSTIEIMKVWEKERETVRTKYHQQLEEWRKESEKAKAENRQPPERPIAPDAIRPERAAGILYNSLIEPLIPYAFRGVIWYQGENNAGRAKQYRLLLPTMIRAWRERWGAGDFPFGIVQLPNRWQPVAQPTDIAWSHLRDAQFNAYKTVPKTGLVVDLLQKSVTDATSSSKGK